MDGWLNNDEILERQKIMDKIALQKQTTNTYHSQESSVKLLTRQPSPPPQNTPIIKKNIETNEQPQIKEQLYRETRDRIFKDNILSTESFITRSIEKVEIPIISKNSNSQQYKISPKRKPKVPKDILNSNPQSVSFSNENKNNSVPILESLTSHKSQGFRQKGRSKPPIDDPDFDRSINRYSRKFVADNVDYNETIPSTTYEDEFPAL